MSGGRENLQASAAKYARAHEFLADKKPGFSEKAGLLTRRTNATVKKNRLLLAAQCEFGEQLIENRLAEVLIRGTTLLGE